MSNCECVLKTAHNGACPSLISRIEGLAGVHPPNFNGSFFPSQSCLGPFATASLTKACASSHNSPILYGASVVAVLLRKPKHCQTSRISSILLSFPFHNHHHRSTQPHHHLDPFHRPSTPYHLMFQSLPHRPSPKSSDWPSRRRVTDGPENRSRTTGEEDEEKDHDCDCDPRDLHPGRPGAGEL